MLCGHCGPPNHFTLLRCDSQSVCLVARFCSSFGAPLQRSCAVSSSQPISCMQAFSNPVLVLSKVGSSKHKLLQFHAANSLQQLFISRLCVINYDFPSRQLN